MKEVIEEGLKAAEAEIAATNKTLSERIALIARVNEVASEIEETLRTSGAPPGTYLETTDGTIGWERDGNRNARRLIASRAFEVDPRERELVPFCELSAEQRLRISKHFAAFLRLVREQAEADIADAASVREIPKELLEKIATQRGLEVGEQRPR